MGLLTQNSFGEPRHNNITLDDEDRISQIVTNHKTATKYNSRLRALRSKSSSTLDKIDSSN